MAYFPMMVDLNGKKVLIVGGGKVAARKAALLSSFGACVMAVAESFSDDFPDKTERIFMKLDAKEMENINALVGHRSLDSTRQECQETLKDWPSSTNFFLVVAATDDGELNHQIAVRCRQAGIPVNAVDQEEDCDFIFPAIVRRGDVVVSASSGGKSPLMAQYVKHKIEETLPENIGDMNERMGELRARVREEVPDHEARADIYREALGRLLREDGGRLQIEQAGRQS